MTEPTDDTPPTHLDEQPEPGTVNTDPAVDDDPSPSAETGAESAPDAEPVESGEQPSDTQSPDAE